MDKVKIKVGISFVFLIIICLLCGQFLLLINYTLALILHEMAHFYLARSKGYRVNRIKLDMLGMKLNISENIDKNDHFWIALAGPMINFALCIICAGMWWIVPESFYFTSVFFQANLMLAIFNIIPIEPLDGGTMFKCILAKANKKVANTVSKILNIIFIVGFLALFFVSFDSEPNLILLLFAIFFTTNLIKSKKESQYDLYYKFLLKRNTPISKVNLLKVSAETTLFECFKQIKNNCYTVFYYSANPPHYISETDLQLLLTKYGASMKIKDVFDNIKK